MGQKLPVKRTARQGTPEFMQRLRLRRRLNATIAQLLNSPKPRDGST